jgi:hypothetical protein
MSQLILRQREKELENPVVHPVVDHILLVIWCSQMVRGRHSRAPSKATRHREYSDPSDRRMSDRKLIGPRFSNYGEYEAANDEWVQQDAIRQFLEIFSALSN